MKINPNDLAFPTHIDCGLTKREYFAAKAMQGILAHHGYTDFMVDGADGAVAAADALIAELNKENSDD